MGNSKEPVNGIIAIDTHQTDLEDNDVVFEVRTADGTDIRVMTSTIASQKLRNSIDSILDDE